MNKYYGLLRIDELKLPGIKWFLYKPGMPLKRECLWTVRTANDYGVGTDLPHKIGVSAEAATLYAEAWRNKFDYVLISEYFCAKVSGNIMVSLDGIIIEWVNGNSTDLTRKGIVDETLKISPYIEENPVRTTLPSICIEKLKRYSRIIAYKERDSILDNKIVLAEWSIIGSDDVSKECSYRENEIVFYDFRII